jgi:hypothetical protein
MTNLEEINLVWCDGNVYNEGNKPLLERLREIDSKCKEFIETGECRRFLVGRGLHDPRRFLLIISGNLGANFVPEIHSRQNILAIYVYCVDKVKHKAWSAPFDKVKYFIKCIYFILYDINTGQSHY